MRRCNRKRSLYSARSLAEPSRAQLCKVCMRCWLAGKLRVVQQYSKRVMDDEHVQIPHKASEGLQLARNSGQILSLFSEQKHFQSNNQLSFDGPVLSLSLLFQRREQST